eukprot:4235407-Amphidinium_carterae.1
MEEQSIDIKLWYGPSFALMSPSLGKMFHARLATCPHPDSTAPMLPVSLRNSGASVSQGVEPDAPCVRAKQPQNDFGECSDVLCHKSFDEL